jgi:hypothetical protein
LRRAKGHGEMLRHGDLVQAIALNVEKEAMKRTLLMLVTILCATLIGADQTVELPKGITYIPTTDQINDAARQQLRERFNAKASDEDVQMLFDDMLIVGPGLWGYLKDDENLSKIKGGKLNLKVPVLKPDGTHDHFDTMEGKILRNDQVRVFCKAFVKQANLNDLTIRKLNPEVLTIFWKMIPFDIIEPIFMMESKKHKLLVLFLSPTPAKPDQKLKIMWIDDFRSFFIREDAGRTADADK